MTKKRKNLVLIIIGIIIALLATYFIIKHFEKPELPFNKVELEYNNMIYNTTGVDYLDTILHVSLNQMDISGALIWLRPMDDLKLNVGGYNAEDFDLKATVIQSETNRKNYLLILDVDERRTSNIMFISHEVIHIKQMETGKFSAFRDSAIFDGKIYYINELPEYTMRPWEYEAFELTPFLTGKVGDILIKER